MSDCDDYDDYDLDDDEFESEVDYSSDDDGEYDPNREYPTKWKPILFVSMQVP